MRRHKKAFKKESIPRRIRTHLIAQTGRRQLMRRGFDQIGTTDDITSCRSDPATGIFDQRAGCNISADFDRFLRGGKLSVAIVDKTNRLRIFRLDDTNDFGYFSNCQCFSFRITTRALDQYQTRFGSYRIR